MTKPSALSPSCPVATPDSLDPNLSQELDMPKLLTRLSELSGNKSALFTTKSCGDSTVQEAKIIISVEGPGNSQS